MKEKLRRPPTVRIGEGEWMIVSSSADIPLVKAEIKTAKKLKINLEKFANVKKFLLQGKNKNQVSKLTSVSRTTIDKYIKLYEKDTQEAIQAVHQMDTKWTPNDQSVQCNVLILFAFSFDWTLLFQSLFFVLLAIGGGVVWWQWTLLMKRVYQYKLERAALKNDFYQVLNLRFPTTAVIVWTETQASWLIKMNVHYASGRMTIIQVKRMKSDDAWSYHERAEEERLLWNSCNREKIEQVERQRKEWLDTLDEKGYLDYLKGYHYGSWEKSKQFLEEDLAYYRQNPRPVYSKYQRTALEKVEALPHLNE